MYERSGRNPHYGQEAGHLGSMLHGCAHPQLCDMLCAPNRSHLRDSC